MGTYDEKAAAQVARKKQLADKAQRVAEKIAVTTDPARKAELQQKLKDIARKSDAVDTTLTRIKGKAAAAAPVVAAPAPAAVAAPPAAPTDQAK